MKYQGLHFLGVCDQYYDAEEHVVFSFCLITMSVYF